MEKINKPALLLFFLTLISCSEKKEYYDTGGLRAIYSKQGDTIIKDIYSKDSSLIEKKLYIHDYLYSSVTFNNNKKVDYKRFISKNRQDVKTYDANGKIYSSGILVNDAVKEGWWTFYKNGFKEKHIEYIPLCNNEYYLNQIIKANGLNKNYPEAFFNIDIKKVSNKYQIDYFFKGTYKSSKLFLFLSDKQHFCDISTLKEFDLMIDLGKNHEGIFYIDNLNYRKGFFLEQYVANTDTLNGKKLIMGKKFYVDLKNYPVKK